MTPETFVKAQIAAFSYREAAHLGGLDPVTAVACILRNRVAAGWFGGDWLEALNHAGESAAFPPREAVPVTLSSPALRRLFDHVDDLYMGQFKDQMTEGGLYWLDTTQDVAGMRPFFRDTIFGQPERHRRVAQVGTLWIFS